VGVVPHVVRLECFEKGGLDFFARGDGGEGHGLGGIEESVQMGVQHKYFAVIDSKAFPNGVSSLNRAVKDRDFSLLTRQKFSTDMYENIGVAWIG
jgi:hypothetical protein